jgi:uncharacterized protein
MQVSMKKWLLVVLCGWLSGEVCAVKVSHLYEAELPVVSQSSEVRAEAIRQGLIQVLGKVSGEMQIEKKGILPISRQRAFGYLEEYSYVPSSLPTTPYLLKLRFQRHGIHHLLKQAHLDDWGENRPLILAWLVIPPKAGVAMVIGSETSGRLVTMVRDEAKRHGVPLLFPMLDMTEMDQLSTMEGQAMTWPMLKKIGERYKPDAYLMGHIQSNGAGFHSQWQLMLDDQQWDWTLTGQSVDSIITCLMDHISETLSQHFQASPASISSFWLALRVSHVSERADLNRLVHYLKQLPLVQKVQLMQVSGDVVELELLIRGTLAAFQKNVAIGQHLTLISSETDELAYEWVH